VQIEADRKIQDELDRLAEEKERLNRELEKVRSSQAELQQRMKGESRAGMPFLEGIVPSLGLEEGPGVVPMSRPGKPEEEHRGTPQEEEEVP
jgi:hypothetical protein